MSTVVNLPDGPITLSGHGAEFAAPGAPFTSRVAYAAAHVVADPRAENIPGAPPVIDWAATLAFRRHLWAHGFGVAEAMDTAQRGMGLDYPAARELIHGSAAEARSAGGTVAAGVATDQLPPGPATIDDIRRAYAEQRTDVQEAGAGPVLMCSRHLAAAADKAEQYLDLYQDHFTMVGGAQSGRSPAHLAELIRLADAAGLLPDADLATARARAFFTTAGVDQP